MRKRSAMLEAWLAMPPGPRYDVLTSASLAALITTFLEAPRPVRVKRGP